MDPRTAHWMRSQLQQYATLQKQSSYWKQLYHRVRPRAGGWDGVMPTEKFWYAVGAATVPLGAYAAFKKKKPPGVDEALAIRDASKDIRQGQVPQLIGG